MSLLAKHGKLIFLHIHAKKLIYTVMNLAKMVIFFFSKLPSLVTAILPPCFGGHLDINWTEPSWTNFTEVPIKIKHFSYKKMYSEISGKLATIFSRTQCVNCVSTGLYSSWLAYISIIFSEILCSDSRPGESPNNVTTSTLNHPTAPSHWIDQPKAKNYPPPCLTEDDDDDDDEYHISFKPTADHHITYKPTAAKAVGGGFGRPPSDDDDYDDEFGGFAFGNCRSSSSMVENPLTKGKQARAINQRHFNPSSKSNEPSWNSNSNSRHMESNNVESEMEGEAASGRIPNLHEIVDEWRDDAEDDNKWSVENTGNGDLVQEATLGKRAMN